MCMETVKRILRTQIRIAGLLAKFLTKILLNVKQECQLLNCLLWWRRNFSEEWRQAHPKRELITQSLGSIPVRRKITWQGVIRSRPYGLVNRQQSKHQRSMQQIPLKHWHCAMSSSAPRDGTYAVLPPFLPSGFSLSPFPKTFHLR